MANAGLNLEWLTTGEGPMLESQDLMVREPRATYMGSVEQARRQAVSKIGYSEAKDILQSLCDELSFTPTGSWLIVLHELLHIYRVEPAAIRLILETLQKTEVSDDG